VCAYCEMSSEGFSAVAVDASSNAAKTGNRTVPVKAGRRDHGRHAVLSKPKYLVP